MSDYLLKRRAISQGLAEKPPTKKEPKPIPKKSAKRIEEDKKLAKIREEMKKEKGARCAIQSPVCLGFVQGLNHIQKTSPKNRLEKNNLELCCNPCNQFIETNRQWAEDNGHFISRFTIHDKVEDKKIKVHDKI